MTAEKRKTGGHSGIDRWIAHEDGEMYRGQTQDIDSVIKHVRHMDDVVNGAPKSGNRNDWKYAGSIPISVLTDWLKENHYTWPQYATNEDGAKDKFKKLLKTREFHKLRAHG